MNKILSMVLPVYNTEKYIKRCLDSIVIDDVTCFKVKYKTMSISNNEEWEFEILN